MPINPDRHFEKLLHQQKEKFLPVKEKTAEKKTEKAKDRIETSATSSIPQIKVTPQNAHQIAIKMLDAPIFKRILKSLIGELIVQKQLFTKLDMLMKLVNDEEYFKLYGITHKHFEDISNGNLTSFDLAVDDNMVAITFKKQTGEPAFRYIDNKILAQMVKKILMSRPELQSDLQSG